MAAALVFAGKITLKSPEVDVFVPPKSNTHTAGLVKEAPVFEFVEGVLL
jgi:hypothetical protein